ncbi:MAG: S1C family serine protease [Thermomicrobiales bacterium]
MDPNRVEPSRRHRGVVITAFLTLLIAIAVAGFNVGGALANSVATPDAQPSARHQSTDTIERSVADVAEQANLAVVTVTNLQAIQDPFGRGSTDEPRPVGAGSGYIIDEDGHVVTNAHVVAGGAAFEVLFSDGTTAEAELVGVDEFQDVAVLKLNLDAGQSVPGTVSFGDSDAVRAGDHVVAIGSPYGEFTNSVTDGTVNAIDRALETPGGYDLPNLIQHDAPIFPGNSGGPLLNMDGEVIGMNVAKAFPRVMNSSATDSNFGFAIESNAVRALVEQLIEDGTANRPYLGIQGREVVEGVQGVSNWGEVAGHEIVNVEPNTPAAEAGLRAGDVITAIDGEEIDDDTSLVEILIFGRAPGDTVELTIDRDGDEQAVAVTLAERPTDLTEA